MLLVILDTLGYFLVTFKEATFRLVRYYLVPQKLLLKSNYSCSKITTRIQ
jgi:hypothetical protein